MEEIVLSSSGNYSKVPVNIYKLSNVPKFKIIIFWLYSVSAEHLIIWELLNKSGGEQKDYGFITK